MIGFAAATPLIPDPDDARGWVLRELSKPEYTAAQPTLFDRLSAAFFDWIRRLLTSGTSLPSDWLILLVVVVLLLAAIAALLIWGRPRRNRRVRDAPSDALFGVDDRRDTVTLRRDSERAAKNRDYSLAYLERFRALSRDLAERTLITLDPGTTAQAAMAQATGAFPSFSREVLTAASIFDAVRYDNAVLGAEQWSLIRDLDSALQRTTPVLAEAVGIR